MVEDLQMASSGIAETKKIRLWVISAPGADYFDGLKKEGFPSEQVESMLISDEAAVFEAAEEKPDVVLVGFGKEVGPTTRRLLGRLREARWVHILSAGLDHAFEIGAREFQEAPFVLSNAKGVFGPALGEYAVAAMMYFAKSLRRLVDNQRARVWDRFFMEELAGRTLGIVGLGGIGQAAADRARPLGMRVMAVRRRPGKSAPQQPGSNVDECVGPEQLDALLAQSDYVLVATPLTPETRGLISEARLRLMKPTAVLINLGRGPLVDEEALAAALREGRLRGAALDVFCTEPLPSEHPFFALENVLLSPHNADQTDGFISNSFAVFTANLHRFLQDRPLENVVDKHLGY